MTRRYVLERLKERSTWLGITAVAIGIGVGIEPALAELIAALTADR